MLTQERRCKNRSANQDLSARESWRASGTGPRCSLTLFKEKNLFQWAAKQELQNSILTPQSWPTNAKDCVTFFSSDLLHPQDKTRFSALLYPTPESDPLCLPSSMSAPNCMPPVFVPLCLPLRGLLCLPHADRRQHHRVFVRPRPFQWTYTNILQVLLLFSDSLKHSFDQFWFSGRGAVFEVTLGWFVNAMQVVVVRYWHRFQTLMGSDCTSVLIVVVEM